MVLNEASLPFNTQLDCENNIESFFELLHKAKLHNIQFARVDEIEGNWGQLNYAEGFAFGSWLNNIRDKDRERQVKSVLSSVKCPAQDINNNRQGVDVTSILFVLAQDENIDVTGLGFASLNESHGISFSSDNCWRQSSISILKLSMQNGEEFRESIDVPNVCTKAHLEPYILNFETKKRQNKQYLEGLDTDNNEDFENLLFTRSALKSLGSSSLQALDFQKVVSVLHRLDEAISISENLSDLAGNSELNISGESETTMSNKTLVRLRTFKHPLLGRKVFEIHIKNFIGGKRMHILPDYELKKVCVGYFGNHIKTSSD